MSPRFGPTAREPATPLWWGGIALRVLTVLFALGAALVYQDEYQRPRLAWLVVAAMLVWTALTGLVYSREVLRWRWRWFVIADVAVTCGLMLTSPWILSHAQLWGTDPLITTVWVAGVPVVAGTRFGGIGGVLVGLVLGGATALARQHIDLDVARDSVLLVATGLLIGMSATTARKSAAVLAEALRAEAAAAERERLARSLHDSVLQVLARVRRRGTELGGEAAELALLAGEQEITLRKLVTAEPAVDTGDSDLCAALQGFSSSRVQVATPATQLRLPAHLTTELTAVVREALSNVEKHAGNSAKAWVLLEDLGDEVVLTVRDDGPGIAEGRLAAAEAEGHLGVARSMRGRVAELGGTVRHPGNGARAGNRMGGSSAETGTAGAMISVLVVDDHPIWRDAVARDLVANGFAVPATAPDAKTAVRIATTMRPNVVLMDLNLPDNSGVDATRKITGACADTRVLVLSASDAHADVLEAVKAGACGYLVKSASAAELVDAVRRTAAGDAVFTPGLAGMVLGEYRRMVQSPDESPTAPRLTDRETEVLRLVAKGLTARQIAQRLVLSHRTVENHVQSTLRKLHLHNRVELTRYAIEHGLDEE